MKYTAEYLMSLDRDAYKVLEHEHLQNGSGYTLYYIYADDVYLLFFERDVVCEAKNELQIYKKLASKIAEWTSWFSINLLDKIDGTKYLLASEDWDDKIRIGVWDEGNDNFYCPYTKIVLVNPEFYKEYSTDIY